MLQNAYFLAKIGADTAENEQHFAEILPKTGNYPTGPAGQSQTSSTRSQNVLSAEECCRAGYAVRADFDWWNQVASRAAVDQAERSCVR